MRTSLSLMLCFVLVLGASIGTAGQEGQAVPDLEVPADAEPFVGTEACEMTYFDGSESIEGVSYIVEHFSCTTETTDPRATGTEELDVYSRNGPMPLPWTAHGEFSTEGGSWHGQGQGMVDPRGRSPFGTPGRPFNYGEMTYVGTGAYEGLVMHYYFAGGDDLTGVAGWIAQADETEPAERPAPQRGVVYGDDDAAKQVIHVYGLEPRDAPRPALILVHGGALVVGSPGDMASTIPSMLDQGYVVFNTGYRLFDPDSGANPWPAQLEDVQRAVRWVRAHADEYNVDPGRICALGASSGGQLVGLLGTTDVAEDDDAALDGISSRVDCVVSLAGDADLLVPYDNPDYDFTELTGMILGASVEERPDIWEDASPAHNVDGDTVPFLIIHGTHDEYVPVEMARNLVDALNEAERDVVYAEYETLTHVGLEWHRRAWGLIDAFLAGELHPER